MMLSRKPKDRELVRKGHEQVDDEQGPAVRGPEDVGSHEVASPQQEADASPDPRSAARPGLPSGRDPGAERRPRLRLVDGGIDEAVLRLAHRIVELAADKKASDIVLLDVRAQTTMTDYFVICSGASDRQLGAIADGIVEGAKSEGDTPFSREGEASSHWLLVDFGGVIVHVMSRPEREFYQLEKLWSEAALLVHIV
jgi:ribosome-associated protein